MYIIVSHKMHDLIYNPFIKNTNQLLTHEAKSAASMSGLHEISHCPHGWGLTWRHNERDDVSDHQPHDCVLNRLYRRGSKKTSKLRVTGLSAGNSPVTGEFTGDR